MSDTSSKMSETSSKMSETSPKMADTSPKMADTSPKMADTSPKMAETSPKMADTSPKMADTSPKMGDTSPKMGDTSPKMAETSPKMADTSPKMADTSPKMADTSPKMGDTSPKMAETSPKMADTSPKMGDTSPKMAETSPKMSPPEPVVYGDEASPPVRFVLMTAKLLGVEIHLHPIDLFKGENKSPFYTKINPLQKLPALSINGEVICDSHAIALYLCRICENQDLYPADNLLRAKVDQLLYFNATTLFPIDSLIFTDLFAGKWFADKPKLDEWFSALDHLEMHLSKNKWLTGDKMRLCDICCAMTVSSMDILFTPLDRHSKVKEWMLNMEELPCSDINKRGIERLTNYIQKLYSTPESFDE